MKFSLRSFTAFPAFANLAFAAFFLGFASSALRAQSFPAFDSGGTEFLRVSIVSGGDDTLTVNRDGSWTYATNTAETVGVVTGLNPDGSLLLATSGTNFGSLTVFETMPQPAALGLSLENWRTDSPSRDPDQTLTRITSHTNNSLVVSIEEPVAPGTLAWQLQLFYRQTGLIPEFEVSADNASPDSAELRVAISNTGGIPVDRINVRWGEFASFLPNTLTRDGPLDVGLQSFSLDSLTAGTTYYYEVTLTNAAGTTLPVTGSFDFAAFESAPDFTVSFVPTAATAGNVTVQITQDQNLAIDSILFQWGSGASSLDRSWTQNGPFVDNTHTETLTNLVRDTIYFYRATVTNEQNESTILTGQFTFDTTDFEPVFGVDFALASTSSVSAYVNISDTRGSAVSGITLRWGRSADNLGNTQTNDTPTAPGSNPFTISGLSDGDVVFYSITVDSGFGTSAPLAGSFTFNTTPVLPTFDFSVVPSDGDSATASVNILDDRGEDVTAVSVLFGSSASVVNTPWTTAEVAPFNTGDSVTGSFDNLVKGQTYFYRVVLTNSFGQTLPLTGQFTFDTTDFEPLFGVGFSLASTSAVSADVNISDTRGSAVSGITLRWGRSAGNLGNTQTNAAPTAPGSNPFTISGLSDGDVVFYSVTVESGFGTSAPLAGSFTFNTTPVLPTFDFSVVPSDGDSATASVNILDDHGEDVTAVSVLFGSSASVVNTPWTTAEVAPFNTGDSVTGSFDNLVKGQTYFYRVVLTNSFGQTLPLTGQFTFDTTDFEPVFGVDFALASTSSVSADVNISDTRGSAVSGITLRWGRSAGNLGNTQTNAAPTAPGSNPFTISGLSDGDVVFYSITVESGFGTSAPLAGSFTFNTTPVLPTFDFSVVPSDGVSATASVNILDDRGEDVTAVSVLFGSSASVVNTPWTTAAVAPFNTGDSVTGSFDNLVKGQTYFYRVVLTNSFGATLPLTGQFTFDTTDFEPVFGVDFALASTSAVSADVNISDTRGSAVSGITLRWGRSAGNLGTVLTDDTLTAPGSNPFTISGLSDGDVVFYSITVESGFGTSAPLAGSFTFNTTPVLPTFDFSVVPSYGDSATASVNILDDRGEDVTAVSVLFGSSASVVNTPWTTAEVAPFNTGDSVTGSFDNLLKGQTYFYRVVLTNSFGQTLPLTGQFTFDTTDFEPVFGVDFTLASTSAVSADVNISDTRGSAVSAVTLRWGRLAGNLGNTQTNAAPTAPGSNPFTISGLSDGDVVFYSITVESGFGTSAPLAGSFTFNTTPVLPTFEFSVVPSDGDSATASVNILDDRGEDVTAVSVLFGSSASVVNTAWTTAEVAPFNTGDSVTGSFDNLVKGQTYFYRVVLTNSFGQTLPLTGQFTFDTTDFEPVFGVDFALASTSAVSADVNISDTRGSAVSGITLRWGRSAGNLGNTQTNAAPTAPGSNPFTISGLSDGDVVFYSITVESGFGTSAPLAGSFTFNTTPVLPTFDFSVVPSDGDSATASVNILDDRGEDVTAVSVLFGSSASVVNTAWTTAEVAPFNTGDSVTGSFDNLLKGQTYFYRVVLTNSFGQTLPLTGQFTFDTADFEPVFGVDFALASTSAVSADVNISDTRGSAVSGITLRWGRSAGNLGNTQTNAAPTAPGSNPFTISGLSDGDVVFYSITVESGFGTSAPLAGSFTFNTTPVLPTFDFSVVPSDGESATASVNILDDRGEDVTAVSVLFGSSASVVNTPWTTAEVAPFNTGDSVTGSFDNLLKGQTYFYRVVLTNSFGQTLPLTGQFTFDTTDFEPVFGVDFTLASTSAVSADVNISDTRGSAVSGITLRWGRSAGNLGNTQTNATPTAPGSNPFTISGLSDGDVVFYSITVESGFGTSAPLAGSFTFNTTPVLPTFDFSVVPSDGDSATASVSILDDRGEDVTAVSVLFGSSASVVNTPWTTAEVAPFNTGDSVTGSFDNLLKGQTYFYRVVLTNSFGQTLPLTGQFTFDTTDFEPVFGVDFALASTSAVSADVNISDTRGSAVSGITLRWGRSAGNLGNTQTNATPTAPGSNPFTISGLSDGDVVFYSITVESGFGTSAPLAGSFTFNTTPVLPTFDFSVVPSGASRALGTVRIFNDNGFPVNEVSVHFGTSPSVLQTPWILTAPGPFRSGDIVSGALAGLQRGRTYFYRVILTNPLGQSAPLTGQFTFDTTDYEPLYEVLFELVGYDSLRVTIDFLDLRGITVDRLDFNWGRNPIRLLENWNRTDISQAGPASEILTGLRDGELLYYELLMDSDFGLLAPLEGSFSFSNALILPQFSVNLQDPTAIDTALLQVTLEDLLGIPADAINLRWGTVQQSLSESLRRSGPFNEGTFDFSLAPLINGTTYFYELTLETVFGETPPLSGQFTFVADDSGGGTGGTGGLSDELTNQIQTFFEVDDVADNGEIALEWWSTRAYRESGAPANNLNVFALPFAFHVEHGWLYIPATNPDVYNMWYWDYSLATWLWTSPVHYPTIWSPEHQSWLYFNAGARVPYYFVLRNGGWFFSPYNLE